MQHFIGCSGFYNKDWKEAFYPKGLPQRKWFEFYSSQFNALELNTTFYRFPKIEFLQKWYEASPANFKFSVKAPRLITHYKQLNDCRNLLDDFYNAVQEGLKEKLGTILFQFPAKTVYSEDFLQRIIQNLNTSFNNVVEFRHFGWWDHHVLITLSACNISFSGISIANLPDEIMVNTAITYYRFHGTPKLYYSQYPTQRIKDFSNELREKAGDKTAYIFFNNTATLAAIKNAIELQQFLAN